MSTQDDSGAALPRPTDDDLALLLLENVRLVHRRDTCDEAGRPLSTYTCQYHEGYEDGLDRAQDWLA